MGKQRPAEQFAKLCEYILGRRPDEFGLVPDESGFVKLKEFLKAVCESDGWGHVKQSHIDELLLVRQNPPIEIADNLIRARDRSHLPRREDCPKPPKLLYICIKKKSYPTVRERGIQPTYQPEVVCADSVEMAERIGKRRDNHPIRLIIHATHAAERGVRFSQAGEGLYTTDYIPPESFTGPPLPKEPEKPAKTEEPKKPPQPGTFLLTPEKPNPKPKKSKPKWKKDKKRTRKDRKQLWPDEY
ncbi:MAG: RNA 2'-phosphotransferase [Desulfobacterales bacterium]|nr:RNA 2'-phosphotransferase [Desulfobacterales bacterium]